MLCFQIIIYEFYKIKQTFFVVQNFNIALNKVDFFWSHKLFVTLSSVAIASKWDEPEKIKVFIVSTVGRKVLQSRKGERHNCTVWCTPFREHPVLHHTVQLCLSPFRDCSTFLPTVETINTLIFSGSSHFDAIATDESVTKSLWLQKNRLCLKRY